MQKKICLKNLLHITPSAKQALPKCNHQNKANRWYKTINNMTKQNYQVQKLENWKNWQKFDWKIFKRYS